MFKARIYVKSEHDYMDTDVFIDIQLPFIPRQGESILLKEEHVIELENKAKRNLSIAKKYSPKWMYKASYNVETPTEEDLCNLSFEDLTYVSEVCYVPDSEFVNIIMDDIK